MSDPELKLVLIPFSPVHQHLPDKGDQSVQIEGAQTHNLYADCYRYLNQGSQVEVEMEGAERNNLYAD